MIDTPGMRELQLWVADDGLEEAFEDVTALFEHCRFSDCAHESEPGCAVQAALADGTLEPERWESYLSSRRSSPTSSGSSTSVRPPRRARWKSVSKDAREAAGGRGGGPLPAARSASRLRSSGRHRRRERPVRGGVFGSWRSGSLASDPSTVFESATSPGKRPRRGPTPTCRGRRMDRTLVRERIEEGARLVSSARRRPAHRSAA